MIGKVVGILGVGTIGGSIGMRARRNGAYVLGSDCSSAALDAARDSGAIDAIAAPDSLRHAGDVVVIATHLEATLSELARLASQPKASPALLLDVSSVKAPVARAARGLWNFVGTHPMAGSERSGVSGARADLFDGCSWAYVPSGNDELDGRAVEFIRWCGGVPVAMEAEEHDRSVALTSHLPQIVASCYAALLRQNGPDSQPLCGPVARELLRIANMNPAMWVDILRANADNIEPQLRRLTAELQDALSRYCSVAAKR